VRWLNIPHQIQSEDSWCLPACVAMVSAYWEQPLYQGDLVRWLKTTTVGTPARNVTLLQAYGFEVVYQEGSYELISEHFQKSIPCILFLRTGNLPYWQRDTPHAVVFAGVEDNQVVLFDPAFSKAPQMVDVDSFMLAWSYADYAVATLMPNPL
jgi:ABC-type bacteriocin/lantibiotic exporter with double-glycine peptidase domain